MASEKQVITAADVGTLDVAELAKVLTPEQKKLRDVSGAQCLAALHKYADTFDDKFGDSERCSGDGVTSILNQFWSERT